MNSPSHANSSHPHEGAQGHHAAAGLSLDDVLFTVFRHKWLIAAFMGLGLIGALTARFVRPPLYASQAKLMVRYVLDTKGVNPPDPDSQIKPTDPGGQSIISSEVEILTSLDVAAQVADIVGPARILEQKGGGNDRMSAAGVIVSGLNVEPPRTAILTVTFKHPDKEVVQPVLEALLQTYMRKHLEVHQGLGVLDDYYSHQRDELRAKLARTEDELKRLKTEAGVLFLEDTKRSYQTQIAKIHDELLDAERELTERKAVLGNLPHETLDSTAGAETSVPADKISDYSFAATELANLKKRERELLLQYKEAYPLVQTVKGQIEKLTRQKADLEREFPALAHLALGGVSRGTNALGTDIAAELAEIKKLTARVSVLGTLLSNVQAEASHVIDLEPRIAQLQRQRDEEERNYHFFLTSSERRQLGESLASGNIVNMSIVQNPTPPKRDYKKLLKLVGVAFGGCLGLGLVLAFLLDLVLDRKMRRSKDVERLLRLPVFLTIPDTSWPGWLRWPRFGPWKRSNAVTVGTGSNGNGSGELAVTRWDPGHQLQTFTDGLRERLMTYFEVNNLNLKKPKMVALTACGDGAGVSTLASGLAASLSRTGESNVLLVDMNADQGMAHAFYKGKPHSEFSDTPESDGVTETPKPEKLDLATLGNQDGDQLAKALPARFSSIVPNLRASDYDYIIFDMPPVSQTSITPRLGSHMDIVLLVLESEKTGQHAATRASTLMRESRSNVAAILNKYCQHLPPNLADEL